VNDSLGLSDSDSISFTVQLGAPTIVLDYPIDVYFSSGDDIDFNYTPSDIDLDSCWLLGDFDGDYKLNQTEDSPINGEVNTFNLDLGEGVYLWNVGCNDFVGNSAINGNKTFGVDSVNPLISVSQPVGVKTSRTGVSFIFNVSDDNIDSCLYNVYRGDSLEVANTSVDCSGFGTLDVTVDADFVFNLYVNDSAGNSNFTNSSFSVDTSSVVVVPPSSGGGSSGGGGGGSFPKLNQTGKFKVSEIGNIIAYSGDKKTLSLDVENTGKKFLNDCKLSLSGTIESWFYSDEAKGIAPGESTNFVFNLNVPEEIEGGDYGGDLELRCKEAIDNQEIVVNIPSGLKLIRIGEIVHQDDGLSILYVFDNSDLIGENTAVEIWILDEEGNEVKRYVDEFAITQEPPIERNVLIELPAKSIGIYSVYFAVSSDLDNFVKQSVVLGKSVGTGLVIFDVKGGKIIGYVVFGLIIGVGLFFIVRGSEKGKNVKRRKKSVKSEGKNNFWLLRR